MIVNTNDKTTAEHSVDSNTLLADAIVDDLFTSGNGEEHRRLVLEDHNGQSNGTGWGKLPMRDRILQHLNKASANK